MKKDFDEEFEEFLLNERANQIRIRQKQTQRQQELVASRNQQASIQKFLLRQDSSPSKDHTILKN